MHMLRQNGGRSAVVDVVGREYLSLDATIRDILFYIIIYRQT